VALFAASATLGHRQLVAAPRFTVPSAVEWPVVVTGRVEVCLLPSSVRSLTPVSSFYVRGSKGGTGLRGIRALAQWRLCALRVRRDGASLLRVG
jgi:hypothetical protein